MKVNRKELEAALNKAKLALSRTGTQSLFIFKDNYIWTHRYNMISRIPFEHDLSCAVPAGDLMGVLNRYKKVDALTLKQGKGGLLVRCPGSRTALLAFEQNTVPETVADIPDDLSSLREIDKEILPGLASCLLSDKSSEFSGIYMNEHMFLSTDLEVITRYKHEDQLRNEFWFDRDSALGIMDLIEQGAVRWGSLKDPTWLYLETDQGDFYGIRSLMLKQKPFDRVVALIESIVKSDVIVEVTLPEDLEDPLSRLTYMSSNEFNEAEIKLSPGRKMGVRIKRDPIYVAESLPVEAEWTEEKSLHGIVNYPAFEFCSRQSRRFKVITLRDNRNALLFENGHWVGMFIFGPLEYAD